MPITSIPTLSFDTIQHTGARQAPTHLFCRFRAEWDAHALQWESVASPQHHLLAVCHVDFGSQFFVQLRSLTVSPFVAYPHFGMLMFHRWVSVAYPCHQYQNSRIQFTGNIDVCTWVSVACPSHQSSLFVIHPLYRVGADRSWGSPYCLHCSWRSG